MQHQLKTEISNPDPAGKMGVVLSGRTTCPNLEKLVSSFTCPGATSSRIIEALEELAICNVGTFNNIPQRDDIEVRELLIQPLRSYTEMKITTQNRFGRKF